MIRLDERLIHGQVAIKWSRYLGVDRIVVANDEAAGSQFIQQSLIMAAPPTAKVAIRSVADSITLMTDPRAARLTILTIVAAPEDLLKVVTEVPGVAAVNIGNYGRVAPKEGTNPRTRYGPNLYLYPAEVTILQNVVASGIPAVVQTTPEDSPTKLAGALAGR